MLEQLLGSAQINFSSTIWNTLTSYNTTAPNSVGLSTDNLTAYIHGGGGTISPAIYASAGKNKGKWYFEVTSDINPGGASAYLGFGDNLSITSNVQETSNQICFVSIPVQSRAALGYQATSMNYGAVFGASDIIGCGVDFDDNTFFFSINGVNQGTLTLSSYISTAGQTFYPFAEVAAVNTSYTNTVVYRRSLTHMPRNYKAW